MYQNDRRAMPFSLQVFDLYLSFNEPVLETIATPINLLALLKCTLYFRCFLILSLVLSISHSFKMFSRGKILFSLAFFGLCQAQIDLDQISPKYGPVNEIPMLGLGTWMLNDPKNGSEAVAQAIVNGYRHFDCATAYQNQEIVGKGIAEGLRRTGLNRSDLWITSKLWSTR